MMLILHALRRLLFGDRAALKKLACRYSFNYGASLAQLSNEVANIPKLLRCAMYNFSNKTCDVSRSTLPAFMLRQSVLALLLLFINFCWCGLKLRWFHALNMTLLHVHAWISLESTFLRSTPDFSAHSFLKTYLFRAKWGTEGTSPWEFYNCRHVRSACTVRGVSDLQSQPAHLYLYLTIIRRRRS